MGDNPHSHLQSPFDTAHAATELPDSTLLTTWDAIYPKCESAFAAPHDANQVNGHVYERLNIITSAFHDIDTAVRGASHDASPTAVVDSLFNAARAAVQLEMAAAEIPGTQNPNDGMHEGRALLRHFIQGTLAPILQAIPGAPSLPTYPHDGAVATTVDWEWLEIVESFRTHLATWTETLGEHEEALKRRVESQPSAPESRSPAAKKLQDLLSDNDLSRTAFGDVVDICFAVLSGKDERVDIETPRDDLCQACLMLASKDIDRIHILGNVSGFLLKTTDDKHELIQILHTLKSRISLTANSIGEVLDNCTPPPQLTLITRDQLTERVDRTRRDIDRYLGSVFARRRPTTQGTNPTAAQQDQPGQRISEVVVRQASAALLRGIVSIGGKAQDLMTKIDQQIRTMGAERHGVFNALNGLKQHVRVMTGPYTSDLASPDGVLATAANLGNYADGIADRCSQIMIDFESGLGGARLQQTSTRAKYVNQAISDAKGLRDLSVQAGRIVGEVNTCLDQLSRIPGFPATDLRPWPRGISEKPVNAVRRLNVPPDESSFDRARIRLNSRNIGRLRAGQSIRFRLLLARDGTGRLLAGDGHDASLTSGHQVLGSIRADQRTASIEKRIFSSVRELAKRHPRRARQELSDQTLFIKVDDREDEGRYEREITDEIRVFSSRSITFRHRSSSAP